ncbi:MAG: polysaccharide deacetylase family protein [Acetobacteraceae bacterium]|nr:polysaccharide deacetylase family protein [Acetobacteraceae bacterium]
MSLPCVALTFDNGPDAEATPLVLEVLARRGVPAWFFVVGRRLADPCGRALVERARAEGHRIGNHTWSHAGPLGERNDPGHAEAEIGRTQAALGALADPDRLFRPVGGGGRLGPHLFSAEAIEHLAAGGYTVVTWTQVPGDWRDPEGWEDRAVAGCLAEKRPVVVLHDISVPAMRQLDGFLGRLADAGASFTQQFPDSVVLMRRGEPTAQFAPFRPQHGAPP